MFYVLKYNTNVSYEMSITVCPNGIVSKVWMDYVLGKFLG